MTFVTARELRLKPALVWEKLKKAGNLIVTINGRPTAIITGVTADSLDESLLLLKRAKAEIALSKLREKTAKSGHYKLSQTAIDKEIKAARKARK